jgi:hypothetical protein
MARFLDGPATNTRLLLRRAPVLLRVVCNKSGKWDALDQLDDTPQSDEAIHVYRIASTPSTVHVDFLDKAGRRRGDWYVDADYVFYDAQPGDAHLCTPGAWRAWTETQRPALEVAGIIKPLEVQK